MKKIIISITSYFLIMIMGMGGGVLISGCKSAPKRDNYKTETCFAMADCIYRMEKENINECRILIEECGIEYQENRIIKRHEYCKQDINRSERQTYNECMLTLIPKKSG